MKSSFRYKNSCKGGQVTPGNRLLLCIIKSLVRFHTNERSENCFWKLLIYESKFHYEGLNVPLIWDSRLQPCRRISFFCQKCLKFLRSENSGRRSYANLSTHLFINQFTFPFVWSLGSFETTVADLEVTRLFMLYSLELAIGLIKSGPPVILGWVLSATWVLESCGDLKLIIHLLWKKLKNAFFFRKDSFSISQV